MQYVAAVKINQTETYEHFSDEISLERLRDFDLKHFAEEATRKSGLTTHRRAPANTKVTVFKITLDRGQAKRAQIGSYECTPPYARMTKEEFDEDLDEALKHLPLEFQQYVSRESWERGHSAGYEEVINYAHGLANDLEEVLKAYHKRIDK